MKKFCVQAYKPYPPPRCGVSLNKRSFQLIGLPVAMEPVEVHHWHRKGPLLVHFKASHISTNFLRRMPSTGSCHRADLVWTRRFEGTYRLHLQVENPASEEPAWAGGYIAPRFGSEDLKKTTENFSPVCQSQYQDSNRSSSESELVVTLYCFIPYYLYKNNEQVLCLGQSAATCSRWFLARGLFYPEDGGDTFHRNVGSHKIYMAPHPRRRYSS
jgi:hypothetical protein